MKIKTQVKISLIVFAILVVLIIFAVIVSYNQLQDIQKKEQSISNVEKASFELYFLEDDYLVHGGTIPVERWDAKYAELTSQIEGLSLTDPSQQVVLNQMADDLKDLNRSFSDTVAISYRMRGTVPTRDSQELKEFSTSTLSGQTETLISGSSELSQEAKAEALMIEQRIILLIALSIVMLILFILLNYFFVSRSMLTSISHLQEGAERIGSGDLDTKIETLSDDELGSLSQSFNEMSSRLNNARLLLINSNSDLVRENEKRKQVESELERKNWELLSSNEHLAASEEELKSQFDALVENEHTLRLSEKRLLMAQEIGQIGCWEYSFETNNIWGSPEALRVFGFSLLHEEVPIGDVEALVEDREQVHKALVDFINGNKREYDIEMTLNPADGSPQRVVHSIARLEKDAEGRPVKVSGVIQDITERKRAENTIVRVNKKLSILNDITRRDLVNQVFLLKSYIELMKRQAKRNDPVLQCIEKLEPGIRSISEIAEFTRDYQDMGKNPPKWQDVRLTLLYGISHVSLGDIRSVIEIENLEIFADPLLEKAFQGLFENSVSHGVHVHAIRVSLTVHPEEVTIIYEDDGIGIPQDQKEPIFLRGDGTHSRIRGLFFVREILDLTCITIVETGVPGKGARFEITVPKGSYRSLKGDE